MECAGHPSYVMMMAVCVALDAFLALPFSYLRYRKRPVRFALIRLVNIGVNIGLNLFFILLCPKLMEHAPATVNWFYRPEFGIGYIFLANLIASAVNFVMMIPELRGFKWKFNTVLLKEMLRYSAPLLVLGVAGIMNQTIDKILYPTLAAGRGDALEGLGIYGANYKIAIIMVMFIQAFRFAYEPFIFTRDKGEGRRPPHAYVQRRHEVLRAIRAHHIHGRDVLSRHNQVFHLTTLFQRTQGGAGDYGRRTLLRHLLQSVGVVQTHRQNNNGEPGSRCSDSP